MVKKIPEPLPYKVRIKKEHEGMVAKTAMARRRREEETKESDFALPPGEEERRRGIKGSYPIDTEERARNALVRGSQNATRAELAAIVRKVKARYPNIRISGKLLRLARRG